MSERDDAPDGLPAVIGLPGADPITVPLPAGEVPAYAVMPALHALVDAMMRGVRDAAEGEGKTITCRAGCGACCRQYVPVSDIEARALAAVIERLSPDHRARVLERFADAEARLRQAGFWDRLVRGGRIEPSEHFRLVIDYFHLGIACPFLEEEACSIHPDRPLICREYLVVSPAVHCQKLERPLIKRLPAPSASQALHLMDAGNQADAVKVSPLVTILDWLRRHPGEPERRSAEAWIGDFGRAMQRRFGAAVEMMTGPPSAASLDPHEEG